MKYKPYLPKMILCPSETKREAISNQQKWALGLIDGDGHIGCEWSSKKKNKWCPNLKVSLNIYNAQAIYKLKTILKCGSITKHKNVITLRVRSRKHWQSYLIPLFNAFAFRTQKHYDYQLVLQMLFLEKATFLNKDSYCCNRNILLSNLNSIYKCYLSYKHTFPNAPIVDQIQSLYKGELNKPFLNNTRSQVLDLLDKHWLSGFVEAEGSFYILASGKHGFALGQKNDQCLIFLIHYALNIVSQLKVRTDYIMIDTTNRSTCIALASVFNNCLLGMKGFEFSLWLRTLIKNQNSKSLKAKHIITTMKSKPHMK